MFPSSYTGTQVAPRKELHLQDLKTTHLDTVLAHRMFDPEDALGMRVQQCTLVLGPSCHSALRAIRFQKGQTP